MKYPDSFEKKFDKNTIIHRSKYDIVTNHLHQHFAKREQEIKHNRNKGWGRSCLPNFICLFTFIQINDFAFGFY